MPYATARLLAFAILAVAAGCSYGLPYNDAETMSALTEDFLRAREEVPAFGGVALARSAPVVFTLGEEPAARPIVEAIFDGEGEVRTRPRFGRGSEAMKERVSWLVFDAHPETGAHGADFDELIGYVVVYVSDAAGIARVYEVVDRAGLPTSELIVVVAPRAVNAF